MVVENKVNKPVDKIPSTLTIASIDNVNKRSSYAAVKSTDVHRGFDGTSVQLVEPKPQSISLNQMKDLLSYQWSDICKISRRTTKLPHYAIHNSKICTDLVDDMIKDSAACLSKNVEKVSFDLIDFESTVSEKGLQILYENGQLKHAFNSKVVLTDIQRSDLLNLQKIAQEHLGKYIKICQSDGIFRYNKTRKIATFSTKTHSISKVKRELKDQRTENSLLRKQIAWSKEQNTPISDLQQFISLPRAIVDHDGLPYKGDKSKTLGIYHSRYPEAFENKLHFKPDCVIIDGMSIAHFLVSLFNRWIIPYIQLNTKEIHIVFDDQSPQLSPKDIERKTKR
ncbi:unnamed protein product [Mytilus coruscus]|uniref:Uncharacterized protein n=1 Tax=Mytilus coruscus TaxID=42192 RepID=A0A6J8EGF0_MYTCO|nr:unnamed protein product [Mytilus coruscus]